MWDVVVSSIHIGYIHPFLFGRRAVCDSQSSRPLNRLTESVSSITPQPWRSKNIKKEEEEDKNQISFLNSSSVFLLIFRLSLFTHSLVYSNNKPSQRLSSFSFFYPHARLNSFFFCATAVQRTQQMMKMFKRESIETTHTSLYVHSLMPLDDWDLIFCVSGCCFSMISNIIHICERGTSHPVFHI